MNVEIEQLLEVLLSRKGKGRYRVAIDGLSRSGKSTLAKQLEERLIEKKRSVYVFHIDDHIQPRMCRYGTGQEEWFEYYNLQWDVHMLRQQMMAKLKDAREWNLSFYQSEMDKVEIKRVVVPEECIVLIEGVFLQRPEWKEFFDFVVYVDCPRATRFDRESEGTKKELKRFKERYWKAEDYYLESVRPLQHADRVIHSGKGISELTDIVWKKEC